MNLTEYKRRVMEWLWAKTTLTTWDVDSNFVKIAHDEGQSPEECAEHIMDLEYRTKVYERTTPVQFDNNLSRDRIT
jgi:hypothetical protein